MPRLGDLERSVMNVLWDTESALSAGDLRDLLVTGVTGLPAVRATDRETSDAGARKSLAATTVHTVLTHLEKKQLVVRDRTGRPNLYRAASARADHTAELMHEVLGAASDRQAALARFIGTVTPQEAEALRDLLGPPRVRG